MHEQGGLFPNYTFSPTIDVDARILSRSVEWLIDRHFNDVKIWLDYTVSNAC
jgi:hypothetical protein